MMLHDHLPDARALRVNGNKWMELKFEFVQKLRAAKNGEVSNEAVLNYLIDQISKKSWHMCRIRKLDERRSKENSSYTSN